MEIEVGVCGCIMDRGLSTEACMELQVDMGVFVMLYGGFYFQLGDVVVLPVTGHQWSLLLVTLGGGING